MEIELHPDAVAEATAAREWYEERNQDAALGFVRELERAIEHILASPSTWPFHLHGTRKYLLERYPYQVVYRVSDTEIEIVAVAHCRREPGYWRHR